MEKNNDKLFKEIAIEYIKNQGVILDEEANKLNQKATVMPSKPVKKSAKKWIAWVSVLSTAAAVIFIVVNIMLISSIFNTKKSTQDNASLPTQNTQKEWTAPTLSLKDNNRFTISDMMVDNGHHIYKISDVNQDDVVITLMPSSDFSNENMRFVETEGERIYFKHKAEYKLLAVEGDDFVITLSCKHEITTLRLLLEDYIKISR